MSGLVRVGVVGTGWGQILIRAFQADPRARVTAVCSTDPIRAQEVATKYGIPRSYGDYRDLLADGSVDAVAVITNPGSHAKISLAAIEAGKRVLCAKPLGATLQEARGVWTRAAKSNLIHAMDLPVRFSPALQQLKELLADGAIGHPVSLIASSAMYLPSYFARDYFQFDERLSLPPASPNKGAWFGRRDAGGGLFLAVSPHTLDRLLNLFGPVQSIFARTHTAQPEVRATDGQVYVCDAIDSYHAVLQFRSGLTGLLHGTPLGSDGLLARFEVHGDAGSYLEETLTSGRKNTAGRMLAKAGTGGYTELPDPPALPADPRVTGAPPMNVALVQQFVTSILEQVPMRPNFEDGYRVQELIEAMIQSSASGVRQEMDDNEMIMPHGSAEPLHSPSQPEEH